ncbi:MAG: ribulose-phosphate 3-epimerase [bacterium JZ-2024 1]
MLGVSILSADQFRIKEILDEAFKSGASLVHFDVMDGHFVPNVSLGTPLLETLLYYGFPVEVHLMVEHPERFLPLFYKEGVKGIAFHTEATAHTHFLLSQIREKGFSAGLALNPGTPLNVLEEVLNNPPIADFIILMGVNPGYGGQSFIPATVERVRQLKEWMKQKGVEVKIEVDGGINVENARKVIQAGADILIAGAYICRAGHIPSAVQSLLTIEEEFAHKERRDRK